MIELKSKERNSKDGVPYWLLVFEHEGKTYRGFLSKAEGPGWLAGSYPSDLVDELEEWRWQNQQLVDELKSALS